MQLVDHSPQPRQLADHAAQLLAGPLTHARLLLRAAAHVLGGDHGAQVQRLCVLADGVGFR